MKNPLPRHLALFVARNSRFQFQLGADFSNTLGSQWFKQIFSPVQNIVRGRKLKGSKREAYFQATKQIFTIPIHPESLGRHLNSFQVIRNLEKASYLKL